MKTFGFKSQRLWYLITFNELKNCLEGQETVYSKDLVESKMDCNVKIPLVIVPNGFCELGLKEYGYVEKTWK